MDYLPSAYRLRRRVREQLALHFEAYGYQGIELPILEEVNLHLRKTGQGVRRWLYLFQDRAGRELCLRPELTASVVRAVLPELSKTALPLRLYYHGAVFRQNQMPAQLTQVGVELIGAAGVGAEAECIELAYTGLTLTGIPQVELVLNHLGVVLEMAHRWITDPRYQDLVIESYSNLGGELPTIAELTERLETLGVLNSETNRLSTQQQQLAELLAQLGTEQSRILLTGLLDIVQVTTSASRDMEEMVQRLVAKLDRERHQQGLRKFIAAVQELTQLVGPAVDVLAKLEQFLIKYDLDPQTHQNLQTLLQLLIASDLPAAQITFDFGFGRTLHYYSGLIFELRYQGQVLGGGGRYDSLARSLGAGQDISMVGFSYTLEKITQSLAPQKEQYPNTIYLYAKTEADYATCVQLAHQLRSRPLAVCVQLGIPTPATETQILAGTIVIAGDEALLYQTTGIPQVVNCSEILTVLECYE